MYCSFGEWYQNGSFPSWKGCSSKYPFKSMFLFFECLVFIFMLEGGRGRKGNWWILFCPFIILVSNVSMACCLSKREFRDCQNFFENKRSSDWSTRKPGFFFFLFSCLRFLWWFIEINFCEIKKGKTALYEATEGGHFDIVTLLVERGASINFENRVCFFFLIFFFIVKIKKSILKFLSNY